MVKLDTSLNFINTLYDQAVIVAKRKLDVNDIVKTSLTMSGVAWEILLTDLPLSV